MARTERVMANSYSVAEAKDRLSALIAEAERGEPFTITRHGKPIVEVKAVEQRPPGRMTPEEVRQLRGDVAALNLPRVAVDNATLIRRMRDEAEE